MKLFLLCGRLDGWGDDIATLVQAETEERAREYFVCQTLLADNGYTFGDRDHYVHQCELVGEMLPDGLLQLAEGVLE